MGVVVGASESPKDVMFDALGLLFLYNLDDIGGEFGFVDEDDWPGVRLGWIYQEMVLHDWKPEDEDPFDDEEGAQVELCKSGCGRPVCPGSTENGRAFDTCCRPCAQGRPHSDECEARMPMPEEQETPETVPENEEDNYVINPDNFGCGGWAMLILFRSTIAILVFLSIALPVLSCVTPFTLIAPKK